MKFLHALTLFATLGVALAKEFFMSIGIHADYPAIGAFGLALTTLLILRSWVAILAVAILSAAMLLPPERLIDMQLDRDIILAAAITIILFPWIQKFVKDN